MENGSEEQEELPKIPRDTKIEKYVVGTNPRLDSLIEDHEEVWIVNGSDGRRPVSVPRGHADGRTEAWRYYVTRTKGEALRRAV